ncbi:protein phosphatase 2C domain-containing protein, partial [Vibrio harveyi]|nr:protein phosphatase 2C domain-containing protein [Vibrio harveyi]
EEVTRCLKCNKTLLEKLSKLILDDEHLIMCMRGLSQRVIKIHEEISRKSNPDEDVRYNISSSVLKSSMQHGSSDYISYDAKEETQHYGEEMVAHGSSFHDNNEINSNSNTSQSNRCGGDIQSVNKNLSSDDYEVTNDLNTTNPKEETTQEKVANVESTLSSNLDNFVGLESSTDNESVTNLEQEASLDSNECVNSNKESRQKNIDSMWQVLEPSLELKYRKDHHFAQILPSFDAGTVSVRGRSHEHNATFRDDHSLVERFDSGWTLLAVADGAGSCRYSREGSKIALETCLDYVRESIEKFNMADVEKQINKLLNQESTPESLDEAQHYLANFNQKVLFEAGKRAVRAIEAEVEKSEEEVSYKDYSTTLLIAIHCEFGDRNFVSTFSIGDGLIGLIKSNEVKLLCEPESGEFAGQTRFLDARAFKKEEYHSRIKTTISSDFKALLVMTDGISDPKFASNEDFLDINVWNALVDEIKNQINLEDSAATATNLISWAQFKSPG